MSGKPGLRIDGIHLCCLQERRDRRPGPAAAVAASEEAIFPGDGLGSDSSLDNVGVELDAAVGQEALEYVATRYGIPESFGEFGFTRHPRQGRLPECEQVTDDRRRTFLTRCDTSFGTLAADGVLDFPEPRHTLDRLRGHLRALRRVQFVELPPAM